jgi:hypothetical protein
MPRRLNRRRNPVKRPIAALIAACALLALTAGCALLPGVGQSTGAGAPEKASPRPLGVPQHARPIQEQPAAGAPGVIGFVAGEAFAGLRHLGLSASLEVEPHVVPSGADGGPTDITFDYAEFGCELLLRHASARQAGLAFTTDDVVNTAAVLTVYLGDIEGATIVPVVLRLHDGSGALEAVAVIRTDDEGRQVLAIARAAGALNQAIYVEFRCAPGIPSESIFAAEIARFISVVLE